MKKLRKILAVTILVLFAAAVTALMVVCLVAAFAQSLGTGIGASVIVATPFLLIWSAWVLAKDWDLHS